MSQIDNTLCSRQTFSPAKSKVYNTVPVTKYKFCSFKTVFMKHFSITQRNCTDNKSLLSARDRQEEDQNSFLVTITHRMVRTPVSAGITCNWHKVYLIGDLLFCFFVKTVFQYCELLTEHICATSWQVFTG